MVVLPDGADAKAWYVSLSRARDAMHVYTRDKTELRQSVMQPGERKSVWEFIQALRKSMPRGRKWVDATISGSITKEVIGTHVLLKQWLFASDIQHRFLRRVSLAKPTSALLQF